MVTFCENKVSTSQDNNDLIINITFDDEPLISLCNPKLKDLDEIIKKIKNHLQK